MTSKWIEEISDTCSKQGSGADAFNSILETLLRVDKLLTLARLGTDSLTLEQKIREEQNGKEC